MQRRSGFTLVELLVAMALIVFIMAIIAEAFDSGITTFRRVKAVSDMNERLRTASSTLRRYLSADHFEGKKRLSDPNFWLNGPPQEGFFRVLLDPSLPPTSEGGDLDGNSCYRSAGYVLHFAAKLRGNNRGEVFRGTVPAGSPLVSFPFPDSRFQDVGGTTYCSPWAEVAFFLQPQGDVTIDPQNNGAAKLPLYTLFMKQKLAVPNADGLAAVGSANAGSYSDASFYNDGTSLNFNTPQDLTIPGRRMGSGVTQPTGANSLAAYQALATGTDVLLTDVLSFDVQLLTDGNYQFAPISSLGYTMNNNGYPAGTWVFDTWSNRSDNVFDYSTWSTPNTGASVPLYQIGTNTPISVKAIQISLRVWDARTQQTRQTSVIVDL